MDTVWSPSTYARFADERVKPFWDLAALIEPVAGGRGVDLGCGDGRLTSALHAHLGTASMLGVDRSSDMLVAAASRAGDGVSFVPGALESFAAGDLDLVFSNSALHWAPDHETVLRRWTAALAPRGQLALQVPANPDHPSHTVSVDLGREWLGDASPADPVAVNVCSPDRYAEILDDLGFVDQRVRLEVYPHRLDSSASVADWVRGASLTRFRPLLDDERFDAFVEEYRRRFVAVVGDRRPYFYAFMRILVWGRLPG